ncbi:class II aldolase/adducin family protein [Streptomyces sp. SID13588]|uniref:class II aldolase/adducin family protein n=1 Tax=Streptomyces sp. SID13588 TaxID=2706051 RepID=UPI0013C91475|nr:class II aldolase/adducin family protein [Streptomyces sp. SID13588]
MIDTPFQPDPAVVGEVLRYAQLLVRRGFVSNTLGNIAIRGGLNASDLGRSVYTKHRGLSLEEMTASHVVVTDLGGALVHGTTPPSVGHQMNRRILELRRDINCVMHVHIDHVIGYFSVQQDERFRYVSADAALVLQAPIKVLPANVNIEADVAGIDGFIQSTNCVVMPNHGVTTLGRTASEAFHRMTTLAAEVSRIITAGTVAAAWGRQVTYVSDAETTDMYRTGRTVIYGE